MGNARNPEREGIDGSVLLQRNANSAIFSDNGNLAVVSSYNSFSGTLTTKVEDTQQINGLSYTVAAETKREGSNCTVFLFGQKVHETYIAKSFDVGTQWIAEKDAKSSSALRITIRHQA
ncbi:MAG: hypothetical protein JNM39_15210 [Bdellovibrionaceae bacterium]|nr:hypothetical protein [Pseudobdellovibrionaceae bacterium]